MSLTIFTASSARSLQLDIAMTSHEETLNEETPMSLTIFTASSARSLQLDIAMTSHEETLNNNIPC